MIAHPKFSIRNTIEPTVIDETLIMEAVKDYNTENKIITSNNQKIDLQGLMNLQLSFKSKISLLQYILKIQNLSGLNRITKLQLDNNLIEKIEFLDHLTCLKWLDLSFNCISTIENLEKLTELTDLSLYNNRIVVIENLDTLTKLNVFSIGNNKVENYDSILKIFSQAKIFKHLQVLNVAGNPFTLKETDYKDNLIFNLTNLQYLDYIFIDENTRSEVQNKEKFQHEVSAQEQKLQLMQQEESEARENLKNQQEKNSARMDMVENLQEFLLDDQDVNRVKSLRGIDEEITKYKEKIKDLVENLQKGVITKNKEKLLNIEKLQESVKFRVRQSEDETIDLQRKMEHEKKKAFKVVENYSDGWRSSLEQLQTFVNRTKDKLLNVEINLIEDIDIAISSFGSKISVFTKDIEEQIKTTFLKILDVVKELSSKINDQAQAEFKRFQDILAQTQDPDSELSEWSSDHQDLLSNKEALTATIGNIKDTLTQKCEKRESEIQKNIQQDIDQFTRQTKEQQQQRNRNNVLKIYEDINKFNTMIQEKLNRGDSDSDDNAQ